MSEPWFEDGLRFRCTRCGNCCTGAPGYVWVNDEELSAIADFRGETVEEVTDLPGSGKGDLIPAEEILARVKVIRL